MVLRAAAAPTENDLWSEWAGEVSIPIFHVKSGELYRLSYRPACEC